VTRWLRTAALLAALRAACCAAVLVRPSVALLQSDRQAVLDVHDFCWLFLQPPLGRSVPDFRAPAIVVGANPKINRYNVSLPTAPTKLVLRNVPAMVLKQADPAEYVNSLRIISNNATMASLAAKVALGDDARRKWLVEQKRKGLPTVQSSEWRSRFDTLGEAVFRKAFDAYDEEVKLAAEADDELAAQRRKVEEARALRRQQVEALEERSRKERKNKKQLRALLASMKRAAEYAEEDEDAEVNRTVAVKNFLRPGLFRLQFDSTRVTRTSIGDSQCIGVLSGDTRVNVHAFVDDKSENGLVRGLIDKPLGWITVYVKSSRTWFAERIGDTLMAL